MLLKKYCDAFGVSGDEKEIRNVICEEIKEFEHTTDIMGNLIVSTGKKGKHIMLAAHMDEVGLIISDIDEKGFLKFKTVGGIDSAVLVGKRVFTGEGKTPGIIGIKAVHLQEKEERQKPVRERDMYIDIGAVSKEDAEKAVHIGDFACFEPHFSKFGDRLITAKALDNRAGCAIATEILKKCRDKNITVAFTAQEEVGLRGAGVAAEHIKPDMALVLETTICTDLYPSKDYESVTKLGMGPVIPFADRVATPDRKIIDEIIKTAEEYNIPWQYKKTTAGGTDAGIIAKSASGIDTAVIALPCRNLHSPMTVISASDYENMILLLQKFISTI